MGVHPADPRLRRSISGEQRRIKETGSRVLSMGSSLERVKVGWVCFELDSRGLNGPSVPKVVSPGRTHQGRLHDRRSDRHISIMCQYDGWRIQSELEIESGQEVRRKRRKKVDESEKEEKRKRRGKKEKKQGLLFSCPMVGSRGLRLL